MLVAYYLSFCGLQKGSLCSMHYEGKFELYKNLAGILHFPHT